MEYRKELIHDIYDKVFGLADLDWSEICAKHSLDCHSDTLRKAGYGIKMAAEAGVLHFASNDMESYNEIFKAKKQFYDQRREYNKLLAEDARSEHLVQELVKAAKRAAEVKPLHHIPLCIPTPAKDKPKDAVLVLSDWHYGLTTDNIWNKFDTDIADRRIAKLRLEVIDKLKRYNVAGLHVVLLGDFVSGAIHNSCRVKASEDVVDQLMHVCERIAELIGDISNYVGGTTVYSTWGNHARMIANIKDSIHTDNLERIIPFWLNERFRERDDIVIDETNKYDFLSIKPCGIQVGAAHGDLDHGKDALATASSMYRRAFGCDMKYFITGHMHHLHSKEELDVEHIGVGSLCGVEDYAKDKRLFSKPTQTFLVFDRDGLDSIHNINLEKC